MKACKSCEQNTNLFKGCKCLDLINEEDPLKLICENCMYAGDHPCAVEAGEWNPWTMSVQIIYDTAQWKKYS